MVFVFNSFENTARATQEAIKAKEIKKFNAQFEKYLGKELTIQNVYAIISMAGRENEKRQYTDAVITGGKNDYIRVVMMDDHGSPVAFNPVVLETEEIFRFMYEKTIINPGTYSMEIRYTGVHEIVRELIFRESII